MGRGNAWPRGGNDREFRMVYVDCESIYGENYWDNDDEFLLQDNYNDFKENLIGAIQTMFPSFDKPSKDNWEGNEDFILLENQLMQVKLIDNESSIAVVLQVKEFWDYHTKYKNLANHLLPNMAKKLFDELSSGYGYKLRVRSCAWTSRPYIPTNQKEAA